MASLSDQIDRLTRNTRAIKATTAHASINVDGPFTRAVLSASLGDLIRDVDPSELGLFSLPESEITRAEFSGTTPLKNQHSRREDIQKQKDYDPEIYAEAALKCIDRYHAVRPMPRARAQVTAILERLILIRENIQNLTETLQQAQAIEVPSVKSLITEEEKRVQSLQARLNALQEREKNAFAAKASAKAKTALPHPHSKLKAPPSPSSSQEDSFWNTPAATARTLRFTDNIMDAESLLHEQVDLGDISSASFTSPMPTSRSMRVSPQDDSLQISPNTLFPIDDDNETKEEDEEEYEAEAGEDEKTVVMKRPNPEPQIPPALSDAQELTPETPASDTPGTKSSKVKINSEVERITTKIWTTMGDTIMPGHSFDTSQGGAGSKPPRAKETIAHLQSLSALSPSPSSPSVSSVSSASAAVPAPPTSQQILTAHMLLALLTSPPQFSLPLNKMKDLLAAKASSGGGAVATGTTRILYGCVAKRLVKIDRSGGEQIVKFDV